MYKEGQSKKEASNKIGENSINRNINFKNPNSPNVEDFNINTDVKPLQTHQNVQVWIGQLVSNGRNINDKIDKINESIIDLSDGFFSQKKKLNNNLQNLIELRTSISNFEKDIEEFVLVSSITDHTLDSTLPYTAIEILNQISSNFQRTYDLSLYKLDSISNSRVTATNILISLIALGISITAILIK